MKFAKSRRFSSSLTDCRISRNASQSGVVDVDSTGCASLFDSLGMITVAEDADGGAA